MRRVLILTAAILAGCATYNADGVSALNRGDLAAAEARFSEGVQRGDPMSINNMGVVYERRGNMEAAIANYQLAARWGVPLAQQNLARLGAYVPPPDLAQQRANANAANTANTLAIMRALQPAPAPFPTQTNCTSYRLGTTIQTDCR